MKKIFVAKFFDDETFTFDNELNEWIISSKRFSTDEVSPYRVATLNEDIAKEFWEEYDTFEYNDPRIVEIIDISKFHSCEGWDLAVIIKE